MEPTQGRAAGPEHSPRAAVVWTVLRQELDRRPHPLTVVDVGGGTGGFAVPLAAAGHRVTVVDSSPDALAALVRRAVEAGLRDRIEAVQGDADALGWIIEPGSADLVLCHSVLEVVDDPPLVTQGIAAALRPGGAASLLVANRPAAVLHRAMAGHLDAAAALLASPDGVAGQHRDALRRRYDLATGTALLAAAGLAVEQVHGVRVLADLIPAAVADADPQALLQLELAAAERPPYRDIATQLHLLARRPAR